MLILSNAPSPSTDPRDSLSETGVADEVAAVREGLAASGYRTEELALAKADDLLPRLRASAPDAVFNLCEGLAGDSALESNVAAILELSGIPFTGNNSFTLSLARDKPLAKTLFAAAGLNTPEGVRFTAAPDKLPDGLGFPLIVKPAAEDASLGITAESVVRTAAALKARVADLLTRYPAGVLAEEYIEGREFNVALLPDGEGGLKPLPPSEIDFSLLPRSQPHITSYDAKWVPSSIAYRATPPLCPAPVEPAFRLRLQEAALAAARAVRADSYGRADIRATETGAIFILEFNPNPDISKDAGYARALGAAQISYSDFVQAAIRQAATRCREGRRS